MGRDGGLDDDSGRFPTGGGNLILGSVEDRDDRVYRVRPGIWGRCVCG